MLNFEAVFRTSGAQSLFVRGRHFGYGRFDLTFYQFGLALFFFPGNLDNEKTNYSIKPSIKKLKKTLIYLFLQELLNPVSSATTAHASSLNFLLGLRQLTGGAVNLASKMRLGRRRRGQRGLRGDLGHARPD